MKTFAVFAILTIVLAASRPVAPSLNGAWRLVDGGPTSIFVVSDGYLMGAFYGPKQYMGAQGGTYQLNGKTLQLQLEFNSDDSTAVGSTLTFSVEALTGKQLVIQREGTTETYERIDEPSAQTPMAGLWRITGNIDDNGQVRTRQRTPRKTLKLLTGSRFQWAAINPDTRQFMGSGGGTYTYKDGKYTETIEFFSKDNSRVGLSLPFNVELKGQGDAQQWYHRGKSSTGGNVSEVWSWEK